MKRMKTDKWSIYGRVTRSKFFLEEKFRDEEGMGMVEIALIIIVLIGLAVLFKTEIESFMGDIFDSLNTEPLLSEVSGSTGV